MSYSFQTLLNLSIFNADIVNVDQLNVNSSLTLTYLAPSGVKELVGVNDVGNLYAIPMTVGQSIFYNGIYPEPGKFKSLFGNIALQYLVDQYIDLVDNPIIAGDLTVNGNLGVTGTAQIASLTPSELVATDASNNLQSISIANVDSNGATGSLVLSGNTLTCTYSNVQDLSQSASPVFSGETINGDISITGNLGCSGSAVIRSTLGVTGNTTIRGNLGVTGTVTIASLTGTKLVATDSTKDLLSLTISNLGGNGATGSLVVSGSSLTCTFANIQDLNSTGAPQFASLTLTNSSNVGSSLTPTTDASYSLGTSSKRWTNLYMDGTLHNGIWNNNAFVTTNATGDLISTTQPGSGYLLIGKALNSPTIGTITGDSNITVGYSSPDITLAMSLTPSYTTVTTTQTTNQLLLYDTTISAPSGSAITLTLPSSTDTLVGKATTDTLTNKTLTSPTITTPTFSGTVTVPNLIDSGLSALVALVSQTSGKQLQTTSITTSNANGTSNSLSISGTTLTFASSMTQDLRSTASPQFLSLTLGNTYTSSYSSVAGGAVVSFGGGTPFSINNSTGGAHQAFLAWQQQNTTKLQVGFDSTGNGIQILDGSSNIWLSQRGTTAGKVTTYSGNILDDSSGNMTLTGGLYLPTSGGTATALNYYEELSYSTTITGPWASGQSTTMYVTRVGRMINVYITVVSATATVNTYMTITQALPSRFYPASSACYTMVEVRNAGTLQTGTAYINNSTGVIIIYSTPAQTAFTGSGVAGTADLSLTYII